jgi:LPXTG-motif cell wall-anchored protein
MSDPRRPFSQQSTEKYYAPPMRGSTALFLAGAAAIVSGTVAPAFSADDPARVAPADGGTVAPAAGEAAVETVEPAAEAEAEAEAEGGLERPSLEPAIDEGSTTEDRDPDSKTTKRESGTSKQPLANASVTIKDFEFKPGTLTISPGDRVTWTNRDTAQHNAVEQDEEFETKLLGKGQSDSVTIDAAGTYDYICTVHPEMKGKLVAESGGGGSSGSGSSSDSGSSSGGTSSSTGSSGGSTFSGSGSGSSSSGGSSGSLPNTGQEQLPLLILGAGLIVAGLLARAFHEYWIWR